MYYKVLNATDFDMPQKRERIFIVSIRKDIDDGSFEFPSPLKPTKTIKDFLEANAPIEYNVSPRMLNGMKNTKFKMYKLENRLIPHDGIAKTIIAGYQRTPMLVYDLESNNLRMLTPKECFRLQGFEDKDCDILVQNNVRKSLLYKYAGNSICVPVVQRIIENTLFFYTKKCG